MTSTDRYIRTLHVVTYPYVSAFTGKQTWLEIWDFTWKFRFCTQIWISLEIWDFEIKFQISRFQWNISDFDDKIWNQDSVTVGKTVTTKVFVTVRKTVTVKVLWRLVKPFHFQSFSISKWQLLNRYLLLPISLKGYLLQKFREKICERLTEHLPSLLVLVQGFQGAPLDAEHTILYLQSMTSSDIGSECVSDPV